LLHVKGRANSPAFFILVLLAQSYHALESSMHARHDGIHGQFAPSRLEDNYRYEIHAMAVCRD